MSRRAEGDDVLADVLVLLRFAEHRGKAKELMPGHNAWIRDGFDAGAFSLTGSLQPGLGGVVLARAESRELLEQRLARDPFVAERVVSVDIRRSRLDFLC